MDRREAVRLYQQEYRRQNIKRYMEYQKVYQELYRKRQREQKRAMLCCIKCKRLMVYSCLYSHTCNG